jgi:hypothetical protein
MIENARILDIADHQRDFGRNCAGGDGVGNGHEI